MTRIKDRTGERHGKLVVLERAEDYIAPGGQRGTQWLCQCDCGNVTKVPSVHLNKGAKSCGCSRNRKYSKESAIEIFASILERAPKEDWEDIVDSVLVRIKGADNV